MMVTRDPEFLDPALWQMAVLRDGYFEHRDPEWAHVGVHHLITLYEIQDAHPGRRAGWILSLAYPKNPLPMNRSGSTGSWHAEAKQKASVRDLATKLVWRRIPHQDNIRIRLDWEVVRAGRRDEDNLGLMAKTVTDGVRIGGVVDDDTRQYVEREANRINLSPITPTRRAAHFRFHIWIADPAT